METARALNRGDGQDVCVPNGRAIGGPDEQWIELVAAVSTVRSRDGRTFRSPGAAALVAEFQRQDVHLPVDVNHSEVLRAPLGGHAPAVGWIVEVADRNGAFMGRVEWTEEGRQLLANRQYRYFSPVYDVDRRTRRTIRRVSSVALVNSPNLYVRALNRRGGEDMKREELIAELGLPADATAEQIAAAVKALKQRADGGQDAGQPDAGQPDAGQGDGSQGDGSQGDGQGGEPAGSQGGGDAHEPQTITIPRADWTTVMNRLGALEQGRAADAAATLRAEAEREVDAAIKRCVVAPSSRDYHLANCRTREGLELFRTHASTAPVIMRAGQIEAPAAAAGKSKKLPYAGDPDAQNVYRQLDIKEE